MNLINPQLVSMLVMGVLALTVLGVRMRGGKRPLTVKKIVLPPFAMGTGFAMFLVPAMRFSPIYGATAFLLGVLLSYPLILTTHFHARENRIYVQRSKGFALILLGLLTLRLGLHDYVSHYFSIPQTAAVFFTLAFGMILPWRTAMFFRYQQMIAGLETNPIRPVTEH